MIIRIMQSVPRVTDPTKVALILGAPTTTLLILVLFDLDDMKVGEQSCGSGLRLELIIQGVDKLAVSQKVAGCGLWVALRLRLQ